VPDALTLWSLAVLLIGGVMYAAMSMSTRSASSSAAVRRPGWIARRRARGGIRPTKPGAAIGYASATHQVGLGPRELALGGMILGAPGSGKTYAAAVLVEALAWQGSACVILDPKPSRDLAEVVAGVGGTIWTIGGTRQWGCIAVRPERARQPAGRGPARGHQDEALPGCRAAVGAGGRPGGAATARATDGGAHGGAVPAWRTGHPAEGAEHSYGRSAAAVTDRDGRRVVAGHVTVDSVAQCGRSNRSERARMRCGSRMR
jgi:hypothetical protein